MCTNANKPRLTEPMQLKNLLYYLGNIKGLQNLYISFCGSSPKQGVQDSHKLRINPLGH